MSLEPQKKPDLRITRGDSVSIPVTFQSTDITGATDANLLFTDASADRVGIGTNAPNEKLEVVGTVRADGLRLDLSPTLETIVPTHTITISVNGTNYKIPIVAA